jgi:shikimate dehydrogenase
MPQTIKLGLLGNNLGRSRAKDLNELLGELHGLNVTYEPMDLIDRPGNVSIKQELERCRDLGFRAVNVTHPYKREAFSCVSTMKHFPDGLTSINTVLFNDGQMLADNTDFSGCCRSFRNLFGSGFKPGRVLMLGAGGVGVAIAYALKEIGAEELVIFDINKDISTDLVEQFQGARTSIRLAEPDLIDEMEQADGLVNATPIGMFQYPGNPFPIAGIKSQSWAFDAIYTPENTEFLDVCRKRRIETLSGFYLFLYQGLDAFKHFTGIDAAAEDVEPIFLKRYPLE